MQDEDTTALVQRDEAPPIDSASGAEFNANALLQIAVGQGDSAMETVKALIEMERERRAEASLVAYHAAMREVQTELPRVVKRGKNEQNKSLFAKLDDIDKVARRVYTRHGFDMTFNTEPMPEPPGWIMHVGTLAHAGGHVESVRAPFPIDTHGTKGAQVKTELHGVGSSLSYAQRRLTCMAFNIVVTGEDDDGQAPIDTTPVTESQAADLRALADEVFATFDGLLERLGVDSFAAIRAADYADTVARLEARRRYLDENEDARDKLAAAKRERQEAQA